MVVGPLDFITVKYHLLVHNFDGTDYELQLHVCRSSQVPGLCKVTVFCVALYKISAEVPQVDTYKILKLKKKGVCVCLCIVLLLFFLYFM